MKNLKTLLLTALAALFLVTTITSCNKDEAGVYNPDKKIAQIFEKQYNEQEYLTEQWTWDGDLLTKVDYYDQGEVAGFENYEYLDNKLNKVIDNYLYYSLYFYDEANDKHYSKIEYYDDNNTKLSEITFQYTEDKVTSMSVTTTAVTKHFLTMLNRGFIGKMIPAQGMDQIVKEVKKNQENNSKSTTNVVFVYEGDNVISMTVGSYITTFAGYDQFKNPVYNWTPFRNYYEETNPTVFQYNNPGSMTTSYGVIDLVTTFTYTYDGDYPTYITTSSESSGISITNTTRIVYLD